MICATEAYPGGGGNALWCLHRLDIEDKHLIVYDLGFNLSGVSPFTPLTTPGDETFTPEQIDLFRKMMDSVFIVPADRLFPLKEGEPLFMGPPDPQADPKFIFDVAFGQPQIVEGEPVLPTLLHLCEAVEGTVQRFAAVL